MAHYNLIFQGKIIDGASLDEVKNNIARLFKIDKTKTDTLFSGNTVVIKKNLDAESTKKYLAIINKTGAIVKAVKIKTPETPKASETTQVNNTSDTGNSSSTTSGQLSAGLASLVNYNSPVPKPIDKESALQLAPVGSSLFIPKNKQNIIEVPDTSHLSMSEAETGSLDEFSPIVESIELPDIDYLTMSEANTGSMEEFTIKAEAIELPDISELDIAAQDNTPLSDQSPIQASVVIPDTSNLTVSEAQEGTFEHIDLSSEEIKIPDISHLKIEEIKEKQAIIGKAVYKID